MPDTDPVNTDDNNPNPDDTTPTNFDLFPKTPEGQRDRAKADELFIKGNDLYYKKEYHEAMILYLKALEYDDTYVRIYNNLGALFIDQLSYKIAIKYFHKALEHKPLNKSIVDNLVTTLKDNLERPAEANRVLKNYHEALQNHISSNTTKVTKIESLIDDTKLEDYVKETENTLSHIKDSKSKITDIETSLTKRIEELNVTFTNLENHALAGHYQTKVKELREDLDFCWKKLFNKIPCPSLGFIQKYWGMILIDIAVLLGLSIVSSLNFGTEFWKAIKTSPINCLALLEALLTTTPANVWESLGQHAVRISPIMILLLWGTRYFNRRIHETVHLIEEYEHKAIVLKSFPSYSAQLKSLDTPEKTALLKYTEKVSHIITESPTHALTRKKTDKLPMEFVQALNQAHSNKVN